MARCADSDDRAGRDERVVGEDIESRPDRVLLDDDGVVDGVRGVGGDGAGHPERGRKEHDQGGGDRQAAAHRIDTVVDSLLDRPRESVTVSSTT